MTLPYILAMIFGVLSPVSMVVACVFEGKAFRLRKNPRHDKTLCQKLQRKGDNFLAVAFLLLAAAYIVHGVLTGQSGEPLFAASMTYVLGALLLADIYYLYLRRSRPRKAGQKKRFWEW